MRRGASTAELLAARSRAALDAPLEGDAELWITSPTDDALALGAFQRAAGVDRHARVVRRGSGGASVDVGPGTLHVLLALARPSALVPCDAPRLVNRYVRPLLRALTRSGATAHYFGRDWVSGAHRPIAAVGLAHDATTGRAAVEAFIAVEKPFAPEGRASFLGKSPATLVELIGRDVDRDRLAAAVAAAYAAAYDRQVVDAPLDVAFASPSDRDLFADPPWAAARDEAIGVVAAGPDARGATRVGGDFMASRDAVDAVERALAELGPASPADDARVGAIVDAAFTAPGVVLEGVRSLTSLRDVIVAARASTRADR